MKIILFLKLFTFLQNISSKFLTILRKSFIIFEISPITGLKKIHFLFNFLSFKSRVQQKNLIHFWL
jgi:hypothetical protein